MERLTQNGKMICRYENCMEGEDICPLEHENECNCLRAVLERLTEYEDTGLTPERMREMDKLYAEKCRELAAVQKRLKDYEEIGTPSKIRAKLCFLNSYKRVDSDGRLALLLDKDGYCEKLGGLHIDEIQKRCLEKKTERQGRIMKVENIKGYCKEMIIGIGEVICNIYNPVITIIKKQKRKMPKKPNVGAEYLCGYDNEGEPIWITDYACAKCGCGVAAEYRVCPYCGQVIDWSGSNENIEDGTKGDCETNG